VPSTLAGFVPAAAARVEVRLGSGRTASFATRAAPFGRPGRIVAAVLPRGEAIRDVAALAADGKTLTRSTPKVAPPDTMCGREYRYEEWIDYGEFVTGPPSTAPGTEVALANGDHRLLIRDGGDDICMRLDAGELNCFAPPVGIDGLDEFGVDPDRGLVAAVYPARVTAVDVLFKDGGRERLATDPGGYTGRYRGALTFLLAPIPAGRVVSEAVAYDASGRPLGTTDVVDEPEHTPLTTALRAGGARLRVGSSVVPCFGLEIGGERSVCPHVVSREDPSSVAVRVPCSLRRTYVFGVARHDVKRVEIVLAGGRRVRVRTARFPHARHRVYLAVLGAREAVRSVRFVGGKTNNGEHAIELPGRPAAEQCGYESSADLY
jgi:hypothetical protein